MKASSASRRYWKALYLPTAFLWLLYGRCHAQGLAAPETVLVPVHNVDLQPSTTGIQYIQGYFKGSGYLDLQDLQFSLASDNHDTNDYNTQASASHTIDVAVVRVPSDVCPKPPVTWADIITACPPSEWTEHVGIGKYMSTPASSSPYSIGNNDWAWCCNPQIPDSCASSTSSQSSPNHLNVDTSIVDPMDSLRQITVSAKNSPTSIMPPENAAFVMDDDGGYIVVLLANCDVSSSGTTIRVNGTVEFVSFAGMLQEIVDEEVPFYGLTSLAYMALFFWFAYLMHQNAESRIDLEEWIFGTISIAFAESLLRFVEFIMWRHSGHRNKFVAFLAAVAYGAKHGVSRGLLVLLCSGVGVIRARLEASGKLILWGLTISYIGLSTATEYVEYLQQTHHEGHITGVYETGFLADVESNLITAMLLIDLIFVTWIPTALRRTIAHLRSTNQERKLERFRHLVRIICFAVSFSILVFLFIVLDIAYDNGRLALSFDYSDVGELNLYLLLLLVAILWRPNPMAREYAYVMEAPTEENSNHDLELVESTSVGIADGSSAADADYKSFPIDSAEAT